MRLSNGKGELNTRVIRKPAFSITFLLCLALLLPVVGQRIEAQAGKNGSTQNGGRAASHMSDEGTENSDTRWFPDPERGWIRIEEQRHEPQKKRRSPAQKNQAEDSKEQGTRGLWEY